MYDRYSNNRRKKQIWSLRYILFSRSLRRTQ
jgi:hypothetical protein